jgi:integrase
LCRVQGFGGELSIKPDHIDFDTNAIIIWGKGGKQHKAPFTKRTAGLLRELLRVKKASAVI